MQCNAPVRVQVREAAEQKKEDAKCACQPDDLIDFVQLKSKKGLSQIEIEDEVSTGGEGMKFDHQSDGAATIAPHSKLAHLRQSLLLWQRCIDGLIACL